MLALGKLALEDFHRPFLKGRQYRESARKPPLAELAVAYRGKGRLAGYPITHGAACTAAVMQFSHCCLRER
jgi:hypothetical protein